MQSCMSYLYFKGSFFWKLQIFFKKLTHKLNVKFKTALVRKETFL